MWGGSSAAGAELSDGAIYDPGADSWSVLGTAGSPPAARVLATAVWTGSVVVVWGGGNAAGTTDLTSGGRYDPAAGTWQTITAVGAPAGLRGSYGFWTGSRVLVYGGVDKSGTRSATLSLYDPINDKWYSTTTNNRPSGRTDPTVGWSGSLLLLYGGLTGGGASQATYTYDLAANAWTHGQDGPNARYGAFGAWDGTYLPAWSGSDGGLKNDGRRYEPNADAWSTMTNTSQPALRWAPNRQAGWSARIKPGVTLMLGGMGSTATTFFADGATYSSTANSWSAIGAWPSGYSHLWGVGVWTGTEFVVWGGRTGTGNTLTASGERYRP